jgi:hypothetical protein
MAFGVWCPEKRAWLETLFGQIQEFKNIPEAEEQAVQLNDVSQRHNLGETYVIRQIGPGGRPVE